jgi:hypothetical protein
MILGAVLTNKELHSSTNLIIFNIAIADLLISGFVDSFTVVGNIKPFIQSVYFKPWFKELFNIFIKGVLAGKNFFNANPILCKFIAGLCLGLTF